MSRVTIIQTGIANTASVAAGLRRCGASVELSADPAAARSAGRLVLPGVGSFGAGMALLRITGLADAIVERIEADRPTLAVCLGLQLLGESSPESPGVPGLGVLPVRAERFDPRVRSPQLGWNDVAADSSCEVLTPGCAYFANSYRFVAAPPGWRAALADHGGSFVAGLERGNVVACQFHPELSGAYGLGLLRRWLAVCGEGVPC